MSNADEPDLKEWVRVSRTTKATTVTVTVQRGSVTMKWTTPTAIFPSSAFRAGVQTARTGAMQASWTWRPS